MPDSKLRHDLNPSESRWAEDERAVQVNRARGEQPETGSRKNAGALGASIWAEAPESRCVDSEPRETPQFAVELCIGIAVAIVLVILTLCLYWILTRLNVPDVDLRRVLSSFDLERPAILPE